MQTINSFQYKKSTHYGCSWLDIIKLLAYCTNQHYVPTATNHHQKMFCSIANISPSGIIVERGCGMQQAIRGNNKINLNLAVIFFYVLTLTILMWILFTSTTTGIRETTFLITLTLIFLMFIYNFKIDVKVKVFSFVVFLSKLVILYAYSLGNDIIIFPDSHNYLLHLNNLISAGDFSISNIQVVASTLHVGHYYSMLIPYFLVGTPESILFFNTLLISISIVLLYKVFLMDFGKRIALFTLVFSSLSLNLTLFGSFILKDSTVIFLGALIIYFLRVKQRPYIAILLSLALFTVRIYAGFAFLLAVLFEMVFISRKKTSKLFKFLSIAGVSLFFIAILAMPSVSIYFDKSMAYGKGMLEFGVLVTLGKTLSKFFFAPLPWNVILDYSTYTILLFDSVVFLLLSFSILLFLIKFFKDKELRSKMWVFIIPILVHATVLGYEYGGDSTRQRAGVFIFLILIMAVGLFYKHRKKANVV